MTPIHLSDNEKAVLLSILRNPEHGDTERAASIDMNPFTFNKIRNNLTRGDLIKRELVPNYGLLGFEILVTSFGSRMEPFISDDLKRSMGNKMMDQAPTHLLFFMAEPGISLGFHVVEDFTSMKNGMIRAEKLIFDTLKMERTDMTLVQFSFKDMRIDKMFDLNKLISSSFSLDFDIPVLEAKTPGQAASQLSWSKYFEMGARGPVVGLDDTEWSILKQLVSFPNGTDQFHCEKSGLSRYRFKKIRDDLFRSKVIKPLVIPNPLMIGLEVLIFSHMRFKPSVDPFEVLNFSEEQQPPNLILTIIDDQDAVGIGLYPNLAEGSKAQQGLLSAMGRMNILEGNPHVQIFSLGSFGSESIWPLTFAKPLIQKGDWGISDELLEWLKGLSSSAPGSQPRNLRSP